MRWHHLVMAVGNFKRQNGRRLWPARIAAAPVTVLHVRPDRFCVPAGPEVIREDAGSWTRLEQSLGGAAAATTTTLLGIDRFLVFGCCIGGPFILKLCELAPERVVAAVLEQPVGITAANRELFDNLWKPWGEQLMSSRGDLASDEIEAFATTMWAPGFAVSVTRDQVRSFRTPMLVLPGTDEYHPAGTGREIAALAPSAELLEPWKDPRASSRRHRSGRPVPARPHPTLDHQRVAPGPAGGALPGRWAHRAHDL